MINNKNVFEARTDEERLLKAIVTGDIDESIRPRTRKEEMLKYYMENNGTYNQKNIELPTQVINLNSGWDFKKDGDTSTIKVNLPHQCDNPQDRATIYRGKTIYTKNLMINDFNKDNFKYFIRINSSAFQTIVKINDDILITHKGSYKTYFVDVTESLDYGINTITIEVTNSSSDKTIIPLEADFSFVNGIFRDVSLIKLNDVYFGFDKYGSQRMRLETSNISIKSANLKVKSVINNISGKNKNIKVECILKYKRKIIETNFEEIEMTSDFVNYETNFSVDKPYLWDGLKKGNLYDVEINIYDSGCLTDSAFSSTGFREISGDKNGFVLNGKVYPLRGINRHAENEINGFALTKADHDKDFELIKETGVNAIRLAHYPQDRYFIDKCNEYGIVIYIEIPWVNLYPSKSADDDLSNNIRFQFKEMLKEYYNYPCICFWGIHNELTNNVDSQGVCLIDYNVCKTLNNELYNYAKTNGGNRLVGYATLDRATHEKKAGLIRDYYGTNVYYGWYNNNELSEIGKSIDILIKDNKELLLFTEYGAGSNMNQGCDNINMKTWGGYNTGSFSAGGCFHPQEYQCFVHENYLKAIKDKLYINVFSWVFADFAVSGRVEGSQKALNDKGWITRDRNTKKDVFYLYKAFYNKEDLFVHVNSKTYNIRENSVSNVDVSAYSNCDKVVLYDGNTELCEMIRDSDIDVKFIAKDVSIDIGTNTFKVIGYVGNLKISEDAIVITRKNYSATKSIYIGKSSINNINGDITYFNNSITNEIVGKGYYLDFEDEYTKINSNGKVLGRIELNNVNINTFGWSIYIYGAFFTSSKLMRVFSDSYNEILEFYKISDNYLVNYMGNTLQVSTSGTTKIDDKGLHSVCVTFDGAQLKVYIDNVIDNSITITTVKSNEFTKINKLIFGNKFDFTRPYNFKFTNISIFDGALTQEEINKL